MADAAAHDGICDLWNQKTIHLLVVFTSSDQDFEIIGVGPTLPYNTLEAATAHVIPNKKPEFYVKCPAAIASRLQPKLAPTLNRPSTRPPMAPPAMPSLLKGRTIAPFLRPALKLPAKADNTPPTTESGEIAAPMPTTEPAVALKPPTAEQPPATPIAIEPARPTSPHSIEERERAITRREHELAALAASLKIREAALRDRETALAASEESLLNPPPKTD